MKVVLLHDWLTGMRGGERVLEALCEMYPEAPLYTLIHKPGSTSSIIENRPITPSFLNKIPGIFENYRKFLPLFPKAADSLKIRENADLVISTSHCVIKAVKKPLNSKHVSYIHSPMRYIYDQFDSYFGPTAPVMQRVGAKIFRNYLTDYDLQSNKNVDVMIANSKFVQSRITKFYNRESHVINPFVDFADFKTLRKNPVVKENYFVMVTAFAPNKRVDLAIHAFNELGLGLKIIGSGQQEKYLKSIAKSNIEFLGNLERSDLIKILAKGKALVFPGVEDFGITPLEALAAGTPVIALKAGGVLETLNEKNSVFFNELGVKSLKSAVENFDSTKFVRGELFDSAEKFSRDKFKSSMSSLISRTLA